jgi:hypothetical protein
MTDQLAGQAKAW